MTLPPDLCFLVDVFVAGAMSFGGLAAVLSSLHSAVVANHLHLTDEQFTRCYSLAVAAPGPNAIFLCLIGYQISGPAGAVLAGLAWGIPTCLALALVARTSSSQANASLKAFRKGLVPIVAGLLVTGAVAAASTYKQPVHQWVLTLVVLAVLLVRPKWNPVWSVLGSSVVGALLLRG